MSAKRILHGKIRGLDAERTPRSPSFEGRFGRLFRRLSAAKFTEQDLKQLAAAMVAEAEAPDPQAETNGDAEENSGISAGYTYLGQFIDHDITFDPASSLQKTDDPDALVDFRTPRFDLDNVYGRGPDDQPYLYSEDGRHMLLGRPLTGAKDDPLTRDLQRNVNERALIGDPRNDENVIISQLQGIFLRFHNRVVDQNPDASFQEIQQIVRWHYQWVVLHDFLPTIIGTEMVLKILPHLAKKTSIYIDKPVLKVFDWHNDPFIPVEFSVAAYRFGHSMIRPQYRLSISLPIRFPIFSDDQISLVGFNAFPDNWAIDWDLFFKMQDNPPASGIARVQPSYKIDSSLVDPLGSLPAAIARNPSSLAERNLLRGWRMGLPSGQDVARMLGETPLRDDQLKVGKATEEDVNNNKSIVDISPKFANNAPLWYYILAEAQQQFVDDQTPIRLGPVGGRIVGEVFVGLLVGDKHSFLSQHPDWTPDANFTTNGQFGIAELIKQAIMAQDIEK